MSHQNNNNHEIPSTTASRAADYLLKCDFPGMQELAEAIIAIGDSSSKSKKLSKKDKKKSKKLSKKDKKRTREPQISIEQKLEMRLQELEEKTANYGLRMDDDFICECEKNYTCRNCRQIERMQYGQSITQKEFIILRKTLDRELDAYSAITEIIKRTRNNN